MAGFGKADIGLIKATAEAERGQFMDENLMIGSAIGGIMDTFKAQQAAITKSNAELEKQLGESFGAPEGILTGNQEKFMQNYTDQMAGVWVSNKGKDVGSKSNRKWAEQNHAGIVSQMDLLNGTIKSYDGAAHSSYASPQDQYYTNMLQSQNYELEAISNDATGYDDIQVVIPKQVKPQPSTKILGIQEKIAANPEFVLEPADQADLDAYNKSVADFDTWSALPDKLKDGSYNTKKYQKFNAANLPTKGQSIEIQNAQLTQWNDGLSTLNTDADFRNPVSATSYGQQWENSIRESNPNYYGRIDMMYGDFSNDNVDNSFATIFKSGANPDKHPDLYKGLDGKPLVFNAGEYQDVGGGKTITYGSDDWLDLEDEEREGLLEMYLRGIDSEGNVDHNVNKDWMIKKYSEFMGVVKKDMFDVRQRSHFENKGLYFSGSEIHADGQPKKVYNSQAEAYAAKSKELINTKFDAAFPTRLIGADNLNELLDEDGSIAVALKDQFGEDNYPGIIWDFDDDGILNVEIDGQDKKDGFNFNDNPAKALKDLKTFLSQAEVTENEAGVYSNNSKEGKWRELKRKELSYHTGGYSVGAGSYTTFNSMIDGTPVEGNLTIMSEETGPSGIVYKVKDEKGVEHTVDASTLFPNQ